MLELEEIMKAQETCNQVKNILTKLDWLPFMTVMCMMFDEYHAAHKDFDPVENSRVVADLVKEVNIQIGEYVND